jgi:ATP-binding cassette subfamily B protein
VNLFDGTVLYNLGGERAAATRACARIGLDIDLDTQVGLDGARLSRGERQLVTFARALVRDPEILVLDEATSAIDPATEARVQDALARLQEGRTTFIVAHRLSTVRHCEQIVVLSHGRIVETGTHDELVSRRGPYAALYQLQHGVAA